MPSPKSHAQLDGWFGLVSVKATLTGAVPEVGDAVKAASGAWAVTVTRSVIVEVSEPLEFEACSETV